MSGILAAFYRRVIGQTNLPPLRHYDDFDFRQEDARLRALQPSLSQRVGYTVYGTWAVMRWLWIMTWLSAEQLSQASVRDLTLGDIGDGVYHGARGIYPFHLKGTQKD